MTNNKLQFSKNLIKLRKERGLSQRKLAELSGLTLRMINYYEKEATKPPIDNIELIAKSLNVSITDLLGTNETTYIQNELTQLDTRSIKKIQTILSLTKENRHIIYTLAEALLLKQFQDSDK